MPERVRRFNLGNSSFIGVQVRGADPCRSGARAGGAAAVRGRDGVQPAEALRADGPGPPRWHPGARRRGPHGREGGEGDGPPRDGDQLVVPEARGGDGRPGRGRVPGELRRGGHGGGRRLARLY